MMFAGIFNASGNVFLFTQGQAGTQTLSSWMYLQVYATSVDPRSNLFNFMAALGLVITVISSVIAIALRKVSGKMFSGWSTDDKHSKKGKHLCSNLGKIEAAEAQRVRTGDIYHRIPCFSVHGRNLCLRAALVFHVRERKSIGR